MNLSTEAVVTVGDVTVDVGQVLRNVTGVETDEEKKSFLQKVLEPEGTDDGSRDAKKAEKIARKIARGESVTPQEKAFLMKFDPKLAQKAELAHKEGERLKHALRQAASKEDQQNAIHEAYQMVAQVSKKEPQFGALLGEAVKAAVQDSRKEGFFREENPDGVSAKETERGADKDSSGKHSARYPGWPKQEDQQMLLEQFFPEALDSIMDCRG